MRVFLITPEEPFHMPVFFNRLLAARREDVVGIAIVDALYKGQGWVSQSRRFIKAFGLPTFVREAAAVIGCRALDLLGRLITLRRFYSVHAVAKHFGVPIYTPKDVNAPDFLEELRRLEPDVIVSASSPQIFGAALIALPRIACVNVHGALLPKYRGILPSFWMLANDEKIAGVTVHYLNAGIDDGEIIVQREFDVAADDTLHSLIARSKKLAAEALVESLDLLSASAVTPRPNPASEGSYFSWPTRDAVQKFRSLGRRFR